MKRPFTAAIGGLLAMMTLTALPSEAAAQRRVVTPTQTEVNDAVRRVIRENSLSCTFAEARFIGRNNEGRTLYEVGCEGAPGFLLLDTSPAQTVDCVANNASVAARRAEGDENPGAECTFARNTDLTSTVQPLVQAAGLTCQVDGARWLGATTSGAQRYEVGCAGTVGYWIDSNNGQPGTVLSCLEVAAAGQTCQFTTAQERAATVAALAQPAGRACELTDGRFVGRNASTGVVYYEVGCANGVGFMVRTSAEGAYEAVIDCAAATGIAGGCRLSDGGQVAAATAEQYQAQLASAGIACAYVSHGTPRQETSGDRRTVLEFQCSDRPWGLVAFLPNGAGSAEQIDCLTAQARTGGCTLTAKATLVSLLDDVAKTRPSLAACDVSDFRFVGRLSAAQAGGENMAGDVVELRCSSGEGYIAVMREDRTGISQSQTCAVSAERGGTRCELT